MNKAVLFLLVLFGSSTVTAQPGFKLHGWGLIAGANFSKLNFDRVPFPPLSPLTTSFEASPRFGLFTNMQLFKNFSLRNEYLYSQVKNRVKSTGEQYRLNYISLPVLLNYQLVPKISVLAGPEFGLLLDAEKKENNITKNITHDTEERSFGFVGGVGYAISSRISLHARYQHGINHIGIGQRSDVVECKLEQMQFLLQIGF